MEKLLNLLNEYQEERDSEYRFIWIEDWDFFTITSVLSTWLWAETVFSKKFRFIERLIKNDKINLWKIKKLYRKSNEHSTHTYPILYDYSYDESLLMLLSIQDNPVEFLVSILK